MCKFKCGKSSRVCIAVYLYNIVLKFDQCRILNIKSLDIHWLTTLGL